MSVGVTLRRTWPVLLAYAIFSMWGMGCLVASLAMSGKLGGGDGIAAVVGVVVASTVGHLLGNALGLARFRFAVIVVLFTLLLIGASIGTAAIGPFGVYLVLLVVAALSGYLGVASRLDVVASWFPLSLSVAAAMIWINTHGRAEIFHEGEKHAIWDPFTVVCLAGGIFLMLVFLATRNALALTVWQEVGRRGQLGAAPAADRVRVAVARPGRGSIFVLFAFTIVVLGITALVSPYLFRSAEDEDAQAQKQGQKHEADQGKDNGQSHGTSRQGKKGTSKRRGHARGKSRGHGDGQAQGHGGDQQDDGSDGDDSEPDTEEAQRAASEAARLASKIILWLIAFAVFLLLLYLVVFPPIRRAMLLRHLDRPLWPVPPTPRVMNLWRRARAALAELDIEPSPGETPRDFARRAEGEIASKYNGSAPGLVDAAAIVEKIDYAGRGLAPEDAQAMRAAVASVVHAVTPLVGWKKRFTSQWGRAPEVEA